MKRAEKEDSSSRPQQSQLLLCSAATTDDALRSIWSELVGRWAAGTKAGAVTTAAGIGATVGCTAATTLTSA